MEIFKECCKNCLLSPDSIVSPARRKEILRHCTVKQDFFICHKASMNGEKIVCATFYEKFGHISQTIRIMGRLNALKFVDQKDQKKLISYSEQQKLLKK